MYNLQKNAGVLVGGLGWKKMGADVNKLDSKIIHILTISEKWFV